MVYVASPVLVTANVPAMVPAGAVAVPGAPVGTEGVLGWRARQAVMPCCGCGCGDVDVHPPGASTHARIRTTRTTARRVTGKCDEAGRPRMDAPLEHELRGT